MLATEQTTATEVDEYGTCRLQVEPEERCGEDAVAVDLGSDTGRCADHVLEVLARTDYGIAYRVADPRDHGYASAPIAVVLPRRVWP